jgi:gliding motility-associated-like protein
MRISGLTVLAYLFFTIHLAAFSPSIPGMEDQPPFGALQISASDASGVQGSQVCVDISVANFEAMISLQFALQFDPTVVSPICPPTQLNLFGLMPTQFNCNDTDQGFVKMVWLDPNTGLSGGVTEPDGTIIFTLCFDLIGDPGSFSPIYVTLDQLDLDLEYSQVTDPTRPNDFETFTNGDIVPGRIDILCGSLSVFEGHCDSDGNANNGSVTFYPCGGTPPYNFVITPIGTAGMITNDREEVTINNLAPGSYDIVVTDAAGTVVTAPLVIANATPFTVDPLVVPPTCWDRENGRILINNTIAGGLPPYTTEWSNGLFNNDQFRRLGNGTYGLTVTDAQGCEITRDINVFVDTLKVTAEVQTLPTCPGSTNGEVLLRASGGTPYSGFNYSYNGNAPSVDFLDNMVSDGWYYYEVEDGASPTCRSTLDSIFLASQRTITTNIVVEDVTCAGMNDGSFVLTATGGNNFRFTIRDEFGDPPPVAINSNNIFESDSLEPGIWFITTEEFFLGCIALDTIEIFEPEPLVVVKDSLNPSCLDGDGEITLTVSGGTISTDYTYTWSDAGTGPNRTMLNGGLYTVTIADDNQCEEILQFDLVAGGVLQIDALVTQEIECASGNNAIITVDVLSQGNFSYLWEQNNAEISRQQTVTDVGPGTYIVTVRDTILGCFSMDTVQVNNPSDVTIMVNNTLPQCPFPDFMNGSIGVTPTGGTPPFEFLWDDGSTGSVRGAIAAGDYAVTITDGNGCQLDTLLTLDNPDSIQVNVSSIVGVSCFGDNDGSALAVASGGTVNNGIYNFFWSSAPDDVDFNVDQSIADALGAGRQYVIVTDAQCPSDTIFFDIPDIEPLSIDTSLSQISDPMCYQDENGTITVQGQGGNSSSYSYQWTFDGSTNPTLSNLGSGTYYVIITDANNCSRRDSVTLVEPDSLAVTIDPATTVDLTCFNPGEGQIGVVAQGGSPGYTFDWTGDIIDGPIAGSLSDGTYFITVTDSRGCSDVVSYSLSSPEPVQADIPQPAMPDCFGGKTCIGVENPTGGTESNYTFTVNRGIRFPIDTCVEVFAGPYTITVFDSAGCSVEYMVDIDQPEEVVVDLGDDIEISLGESSPPINADIDAVFSIESILWSPLDSLNCMTADCQVISVSPNQNTIYTVQVVDSRGCTDFDEIEVRVSKRRNVFAANIFTPNEDGYNDTFELITGSGVTFVDYFKIYDRWGNLVFSRENFLPENAIDNSWNGKYKDQDVQPGVYVYIAKVQFLDNEFIEFKGDITLLR